MNPIFPDTATALHVSFMIVALPPIEPSSLRNTLIRMLEALPIHTRQQADTLTRLRGKPSGTVDFGNLTRLEIRGQCSLIVAAVQQRLPLPELCAMLARFSPTEEGKAIGVDGLVLWLAPTAPIGNRAALTALVWRRYVPKEHKDGYSFRAIAKQCGSSRSTLQRAAEWLDDEAEGVELRALRRLEETFVPHGVCAAMEMAE
jgi:hypothetical protein